MKNSMENNIEPKIEITPLSLQDFAQKVKEKEKELLRNSNIKQHFTLRNGESRHVHPGNVSEALRAELQIKTRAAKHVLSESTKGIHGSKEELHQQEVFKKLIEYYEQKEGLLAQYAEARDDRRLEELASVMEQDMPCLKGTYEAYTKQSHS